MYKNFRDSLLLIMALMGLTISGLWLLREGGLEPLVTLLASISFLITDFFRSSAEHRHDRFSLSKKTKDELSVMARKRNLENYSRLKKDDLVSVIIDSIENKSKYLRWHRLKWLSLLVSFMLIPILNSAIPEKSKTNPDVSLAWYTLTSQGPKLVSQYDIPLMYSSEEIDRKIVEVPIRLAIRNNELEQLKVVRIEFRYPSELKVISAGRQKIDPTGNLLVYEHDYGILETVGEYSMLEEIDIIKIKSDFAYTAIVNFTENDIPIYSVSLVSLNEYSNKKIPLKFTVYVEAQEWKV